MTQMAAPVLPALQLLPSPEALLLIAIEFRLLDGRTVPAVDATGSLTDQ